jgi:plasmid maintenance system antidote protein VapI
VALWSLMLDTTATTTAGDVRAALARKRPRIFLYELAVRVRLNPVTLSAILNERAPLSADLAARLMRAIGE